MRKWPKDELGRIAESDDLHIAPYRDDGVTYGTPTWIWSVVVDDALYVRAYNGKDSRWHYAALRQKAGQITHLAFYVGWPNAMSAINRAKALFTKKDGDGK